MKTILLFCNSDKHFYEHLKPIAIGAITKGYRVVLLTSVSKYQQQLEHLRITVIHSKMHRHSLNPVTECFTLLNTIMQIRNIRPDIIHNFTIKPILYGSIAGIFCCKSTKIINTFLGLGYLFTHNSISLRCIRRFTMLILKFISIARAMICNVQNADDKVLIQKALHSNKITIVKQCSVGIYSKEFRLLPHPEGKIVFAFVGRLLKDKGVIEFVEASRILHNHGVNASYWLVGDIDLEYRSSLTRQELSDIKSEGIVQVLGYRDIFDIWKLAHVAVLPSYREGLSRSLLEAGAYGRAIITSDAPGGRELIINGVDGFLVKPRDVASLVNAMQILATNTRLRIAFAKQIRNKVIANYTDTVVVNKMLNLYQS